MVSADTNVWARAYLNDDLEQAKKARAAIKEAREDGGIFVPVIVLAELFWVLRSTWNKAQVLETLEHLLATEGVMIESAEIVRKALADAQSGAGFADMLIMRVALSHGSDSILTFDRKFGRFRHVRQL